MSDHNHSLGRLDAIVIIDAINSLKKQISKSNKRIVSMIQLLDNKIASISADVVTLQADISKLQAFATDTAAPAFADQVKAFADAHNDASKFANSHIDNRDSDLYTLRSQENKEIKGFPYSIASLDRLSLSEITRILRDYGCEVDDPDYNDMSMGDAYRERDLRRTLHFHLGVEDNFPIKV